ncbi:MAG: exosortase A [Halofilum sp. (in: g-proteobacteria)]
MLALILIGLIHHETAVSVARTWTNSVTYTHGWLILPLSAWLIWRRRHVIAGIQPHVWWPALLVVGVLELVWLAAAIAGVLGVQQAVLIALIPATILVLNGPRVTRSLAFPLGYLVFAIPWGAALVPLLQDITAHMAVLLLEAVGMPVYFEGRLISIPAGNFEVAEACAGIRYLIAALALGTLYAYLIYESPWRRLLFILASAVVPIVANGIRAWGIIMLASLSDMKLAVGVDHLVYGWFFFGMVMFLLFWVGSFWREPESDATSAASNGSGDGIRVAAGHDRLRAPITAAVALVALALTTTLLPGWSARVQPVPDTRVSMPAAAAGWSASTAEPRGWYAGFSDADDIGFRRYGTAGDKQHVGLLVIHYRRESQGVELINFANSLVHDDWNWTGAGRREVQVGNDHRKVRELRLGRGDNRRIVWSWYEVGGWSTTSGAIAKGFAAVKRMTAQPGDATLIAVGTDYEVAPGEARARLRRFLKAHPQLLSPRGSLEES